MKIALLCFVCLSVGVCLGYFIAALMFIARQADDEADKAERKERPK